jgi:hypothetical protein
VERVSQTIVYECDWCGHPQRDGTSFAKVKVPLKVIPESLEHVDSGTERIFDTCGACVDALREAFDAFTMRRQLERQGEQLAALPTADRG